ILRYVFWHSIALASLVGLLVLLQAYVFPWMIPAMALPGLRARHKISVSSVGGAAHEMLSAVSSLTGDAIQGSRGFLRTDSRLAITGKDYKMKRLLFLIAAALLLAASAYADAPCSDLYEQAKTSIVEARVGRGLEMKLLTKVENAWRIFRSGKKNA